MFYFLLFCVCVLIKTLLLSQPSVSPPFAFHPQKYPPRKDLVRAVSIQTGYLIQSTGPKSCVITYLAQVDPKGEGLALAAYHGILSYTTGDVA